MITARQAGWSLSYSDSSSGFQFITARDDYGNYAEFTYDGATITAANRANTVSFFDLPLSVIALIRFWFGAITFKEYERALIALA